MVIKFIIKRAVCGRPFLKIKIIDKRNDLGYIHRGKILGRISRKIIHLVDTYI